MTTSKSDDNVVHLTGPDGSSAQVTLFGAHVISFVSSKGQECFFLSKKSSLTGPEPIRGGIPICWPAFGLPDKDGPFGQLNLHGFARQQVWTVQRADNIPAKATFTLSASDKIKELWNHDFLLTYEVEIVKGDSLKVSLKVRNPSSASDKLEYQVALHNYFQLPESVKPENVEVDGPLKGLEYKNIIAGGVMEREERGTFKFVGETGRIYSPAPGSFVAKYGNAGSISVETEGLDDLVTFHPGPEKGPNIPDLHEGGWLRYVCFEPARINKLVSLNPGESWTARQTVTLNAAN